MEDEWKLDNKTGEWVNTRTGERKRETYKSSGEAIAEGMELIARTNPDIMERYLRNMRKIFGVDK